MNGFYVALRKLFTPPNRRPSRRALRLEALESRIVPYAAPSLTFPLQGTPNVFIVTTTATPSATVIQNELNGGIQFKLDTAVGGNVASNKDGTPMSLAEAVAAVDHLITPQSTIGASTGPGASPAVIFFDLAGKGPFVFNLPQTAGADGVLLTADLVTINGWSQGHLPHTKATTLALVNSSLASDDARVMIQINDRIGVQGTGDQITGVAVQGIDLVGTGGQGTTITGDFIGVTPYGGSMNAPREGIAIGGAHASNNNVIGTPAPADRNVIADHTDASTTGGIGLGNGIGVYAGSTGNSIQNNLIAANLVGIHFDASATTGNLVKGNLLLNNTHFGLRADGGSGNTWTGNVFANNGTAGEAANPGISLAATANAGILPPVFDNWNPNTLYGHLTQFTPGATYTFNFFNNPATDPTGAFEGAVPFPAFAVTVDSHGNFTIPFRELTFGGITATVTDAAGNSSALSLPTDFNILGASAPTQTFVEGMPRSNVLIGTITQDGNPNATVTHLKATVNWGDGTTAVLTSVPSPAGQLVAGPRGTYEIRGNHPYAEDGSYHIHITVTDRDTRATNTAINTPVNVAENDLAAVPVPVAPTEGLLFTGNVGSFVDPGSPDAATAFTAQIDWGNGDPTAGTVVMDSPGHYHVVGQHTYADEGSRTITTTVTEVGLADPPTLKIKSKATIADAPLHLTASTGLTQQEGAPFTAVLATFIDTDPGRQASSFTATITWGDGSASVLTRHATTAGQIVPDQADPTRFDILASHVYKEQSAAGYAVQVQVADGGGAGDQATTAVPVTDAALTGLPQTVAPAEGQPFTGTVAQFTDADPFAVPADYTASIAWGDGTTTTASAAAGTLLATTIGGKPGFAIMGTHTYAASPATVSQPVIAEEGAHEIDVTITDESSATPLVVKSTANVGDAPLKLSVTPFHVTAGTEFQKTIATLTDGNPLATPGEYAVSIDWGDQTTMSFPADATLFTQNGKSFQLQLHHTYAQPGPYKVTVTITDVGGSQAIATFTITADPPVGPAAKA